MHCSALRQSRSRLASLVICFLSVALAQGCGQSSNSGSSDDTAFLKNAEFPRERLAKFSGKVTVDGQPPKKDCKVFVILTDPQRLDENAHGMLPKYFAPCDAEGNFGFSTYDRHDGVPVRKYVVTFVELHAFKQSSRPAGKGQKSGTPAPSAGTAFAQPDELKNLYSDPDTNVKDSKFLLDLQPPGKDDYHFDLVVKGKEPVLKPAPHAVLKLAPKQLDWPPAAASTAK
jgi:hypothetical protein